MPFKQLYNNIRKINIIKLIDGILNEKQTRAWLESLVKERLRETGTDWDEKELRTYSAPPGNVYTYRTQSIKDEKGQPSNRVTLEDTGKFYKTFRARCKGAILQIAYNSKKPDGDITDNVDLEKVVGWTDEDVEMILNKVVNELIPKLENAITQNI